MDVLAFVNEVTPTSFPIEISIKVNETTDTNVTVASFYDSTESGIDSEFLNTNLQIIPLGATSRFDYSAYVRLRKLLVNQDYDILHTHHNFTGSVARVLAILQDVSVVDTEHRDHRSFSLLQNIANGMTLWLADQIVSNSEVTQSSFRWCEKLLIKDKKLNIIYNGVELERIDAVTQIARDEAEVQPKPRIITIGRLVPVKNQAILLSAFSRVSERFPEAELLVVGDGPLQDNLQQTAVDLGIADSVRFTGTVSRTQVYKYLATSDVFVIPSLSEGFCVAAVEAMAASLPVVASDIDVFREVLGDCAIYADPEDSVAFATQIERLLANPPKRDKIGTASRERVHNQFNLSETAMKYAKLYTDLTEVE